MSELAIETDGLTKIFSGRKVVDGLTLQVPKGSVFGFLGPNGSGKTTTVRMLLGLAHATSGKIALLGQEMPNAAARVLPNVGSMVEGPAFYSFLTGQRNLERFDAIGRSRGAARADIDKALALVGLSHAADKKFRAYSLGMKQRLALANALLCKRDLLILDEPTNGLDPQGTREVRNLIRSLTEQGTTVFLSSHLLSEIDQVCTHAAVLSAGKTVAQGTIEELRSAQKPLLRIQTPDRAEALALLQSFEGVQNMKGDENIIDVELTTALPEQIAAILVNGGVRLQSMSTTQATLEEAFVALTGEGFDVAQ